MSIEKAKEILREQLGPRPLESPMSHILAELEAVESKPKCPTCNDTGCVRTEPCLSGLDTLTERDIPCLDCQSKFVEQPNSGPDNLPPVDSFNESNQSKTPWFKELPSLKLKSKLESTEFIKRAKALRAKGATDEQLEYADMLMEACKIMESKPELTEFTGIRIENHGPRMRHIYDCTWPLRVCTCGACEINTFIDKLTISKPELTEFTKYIRDLLCEYSTISKEKALEACDIIESKQNENNELEQEMEAICHLCNIMDEFGVIFMEEKWPPVAERVYNIVADLLSQRESKPEPTNFTKELRLWANKYNKGEETSIQQLALEACAYLQSSCDTIESQAKWIAHKDTAISRLKEKTKYQARMQADIYKRDEQLKELSAQAHNASLYADERNELREQLAAKDKLFEEKAMALANELGDCKPFAGTMQLRNAKDKKIDQLERAIESFGKNPAGFDWAVLDELDTQEQEIEQWQELVKDAKARLEGFRKREAAANKEIERLKKALVRLGEYTVQCLNQDELIRVIQRSIEQTLKGE